MIDVGAIVKQSDLPHGPMPLGKGGKTFAQSGCLLSCMVMAARAVNKKQAPASMTEANMRIMAANGYAGSGLITSVAGPAIGISKAFVGGYVAEDVSRYVRSGVPVIFGIDHKAGASSGLSDADHFVLCVGELPGGSWQIADPATGKVHEIPRTRRTLYRGHSADISEVRVFVSTTQ